MSVLVPIAAASDRAKFGGKASNLAFLVRLGMNVPAGRVVPAAECTRHLDGDRDELRPELAAELRALVKELGGRVSVRSSATVEDAKTHSFAGQFLTVLDVGVDGVEAAVRAVWASAFSDNVRAYLHRADLDPKALRMAVVVQRQIDSVSSGVAMGRRGGVVVEAVFGQGEALVSGAALADHWEVEGERIVAKKSASRTMNAPKQASLTDAQVLEVATLCTRIAQASEGRPQDCEFAFADGELHVLQTRDVTAMLPVMAPPLAEFAPPAKGAWELDVNHFQRPCTPMFQALFPENMARGFKKATERYGVILSHADFAFVNGFGYARLRPVAAPEDATAKAGPPAWVFKLLCKLVPSLRRRIKTAETVWAKREWRVQLEEWKEAKERAIAEHLRLQSIDLDALDDAGLAAHLLEVKAHVAKMVEQHHTYNMATMLPGGDLLAHVATWSEEKITDAEVLTMLVGASPISADLRSEEARAVGAALARHPQASTLLRLDVAGASAAISDHEAADALAKLRALSGDVGEKTRGFLAMREYRLVEGLDPGSPCLRECPSLLWQALRTAALAVRTQEADRDHREAERRALATIRAAVPAEKHDDLDALIAEARAVASLRDERALFSDVWAWGILRATVLAIGERLVRRSPALLSDAGDLVHATFEEILSLLDRSEGPSALELEMRAAHRRTYTTNDAPKTLGPKAFPPPSPDLLPAGAARTMAAVLRVIPHVLAPPPERQADDGMRGSAASSGVWEGPAHIVSSHDDAKAIPAGAVLVVGAASSSFTMLAPLASAVVSEGGGLLSHVAIVCREYRIPCVCGVAGALGSLQHGQRIRVDGSRGVVEVLAS